MNIPGQVELQERLVMGWCGNSVAKPDNLDFKQKAECSKMKDSPEVLQKLVWECLLQILFESSKPFLSYNERESKNDE